MPGLGTVFLFLLLFIGVEFVKSNDDSAYTPSPIDKSRKYKDYVYCDFIAKNCSWWATGIWKWDTGDTSSVQLDGPLAKPKYYQYKPLVANFNLDSKGSKSPQKEFLTSPELDAPIGKTGALCFSFGYYTLLSETLNDGLTLFLVDTDDEKNKTAIWARGNSGIDSWLEAKVDVVTKKKFRLSFEAYGRHGFVGIEKFSLSDGYCDNKKCDFESGLCLGWTSDSQPAGDEFRVVRAGSTSFKNPIDHTSHSSFGHFAFSSGPVTSGSVAQARLLSPEMDHLGSQCLAYTFMRSSSDVQLKLLTKFSGNSSYQQLWQSNNTHKFDQWMSVQQTLQIVDKMQFVIEADYSKDATIKTKIAIDDFSLTPYSCADIISCSFLRSFCSWEPSRDVGLQWSIGSGRVEKADKLKKKTSIDTYSTLLYSDFTILEDGDTDSMELISQPIPAAAAPDSGNCFQISYNVIALGPKDEFTITQIDSFDKRKVIWNFKDTKKEPADAWQRGVKIFIPNVSTYGSYRLALTVKSSTPSTRIAIDSVHFSKGMSVCRNLPGVPTMVTAPSTTPTPTTKNPYVGLTCDFENYKNCEWKSSAEPNNFKISSPENINDVPKRYLPQKDHTTSSTRGHFAYAFNLKTSGKVDTATLTTPWPKSDSQKSNICIDFAYYYYVSGGGSGATLTVDNSTGSNTIWRASPGISNKWHRVRFAYTLDAKDQSLTFRTTLIQGVLALDDIIITNGYCKYDLTARVDQVCDFEDGKGCLFSPAYNIIGKHWKVYSAKSVGFPDRTTRSLDGHFYGFSFDDLPEGKVLTTPIEALSKSFFAGPKFEQCIKFSYLLQDVYQNTTVFGYKIEKHAGWGDSEWDDGELIKKWEISGNTNKLWFTHRVPVTWTSEYTVRFYVKSTDPKDNNRRSMIFIDDFTMSYDNCHSTGCNFNDGDSCSLEPIPIGTTHLQKEFVPPLVRATVGSQVINSYLNGYVEQLWQVYAAQNEDSSNPVYPEVTSTNSRFGNYLLMTADDDWQRAIVATERFIFNSAPRAKPHMCISFHVNKPKDANSFLQIFRGDSWGHTNELVYTMSRESQSIHAFDKNWEKINIKVEKNDEKTMDIFFYFVGTIGNGGKKSYIAIDDYSVTNECDGEPNNQIPTGIPVTDSSGNVITSPTEPTSSTTFTCDSGKTISSSKVCDGVKDCGLNGEDEKKCGSCSLRNHDLCGYQNVFEKPSVNWKFGDEFQTRTSEVEYSNHLEARNDHHVDFDNKDTDDLVAILESPVLHGSYSYCHFSISYRANGTTTSGNPFKIYILNIETNVKTIIYESNFDKVESLYWNPVSITLGRIHRSHKIGLRAEFGTNDFESHSVKYLSRNNCDAPRPVQSHDECSDQGSYMCENKVCIDENQLCDFVDDCGDNSDEHNCDTSRMISFSDGYQSWTAKQKAGIGSNGYQIKSAKDFYNYRMGPLYDHTSGVDGVLGKFLYFHQYITPKDKSKAITAEFESAYFKYQTNCRMSFFYFKNSKNATIVVILQDMDKPDNRQILNEYSSYSYSWSKGNPNFYKANTGSTYKVIITSSIEPYTYKAGVPSPYIAIDDISFSKECKFLSNGDVPTLPTLPGGITQTFAPDSCSTIRCKSSKGDNICLTIDQMCDFALDCASGEDEKNCGSCSFDDGTLCGFSSPSLKRYWKAQMPASNSPGKSPKQDANNSPLGGYAAIYSPGILRLQEGSDTPAIMISPAINGRMNSDCTFRFSYYSNGGGKLRVSRKSNFPTTPYLELSTSSNEQWKSYSVSIGSQYAGFQLTIGGFSDTRYLFLMDMFLDNFKMVNCDPKAAPVRPDGSTIAPGSDATTMDVSCDFEDNQCGWINVNRGNDEHRNNWERLATSSVEPGNDHTSLIEPKPKRSGTWLGVGKLKDSVNVYLRTQQPLAKGKSYCFQFYYYLMGPNTYSRIHLYRTTSTDIPYSLTSSKDYSELWQVSLPQERNWVKAMVELAPSDTRQYLMFVSEAYPKATIGLDDFTLISGSCADQDAGQDCSFENGGTCGWKIHSNDWTRDIDNIKDHTTSTLKGTSLKATASSGSEALLDLKLGSLSYFNRTYDTSRFMCLRFFYYMKLRSDAKPEDGTLIGIRSLKDGKSVRTQKNITSVELQDADQLAQWAMISMDSFLSKDSVLEIFAKRDNENTQVYIDDITLGPNCEVGGSCDFETDFCGWTNQYSYSGGFIRIQPNTKWESGRFNRKDTTKMSSEGHYALFPTFEDSIYTQKLRSPILEAGSSTICFEFYYFAQAKSRGSKSKTALRVNFEDLTHPHKKDSKSILVNGTEDLGWRHFKQQYTNIPRYYRLAIEIESGVYFDSDIGLDDIGVHKYHCDYNGSPTPAPIPESEKKLNCNFENDCKNWGTSTGWIIGSFDKQNDQYAPKVDHTLATSSGRYAMAHLFKESDTFKITSTLNMTADQDRCLSFWYYEDGESPFKIQILQTKKSFTSYLNRYTSQIEARKKWTLIQTDIPKPSHSNDDSYGLQITYSSEAKKNFDFIKFAIDDIKVEPGLCKHQFNFIYNFENGYEDLEVENIRPLKSYATLTYRPAYIRKDAYPSVDHTIGTDEGTYFLFRPDPSYSKASFYENSLSIVNLKSDSGGDKCVRFAYQVTKDVVLKVFSLAEYEYNYDYAHRESSMVWASKHPTPKDTWVIAEFNKHSYSTHKLAFYMNSGPSTTNFAAIDDVVIMNQKCQPPIDCDFEQSRFCSYSPMTKKDKNNLNFGIFTGPSADLSWPGPRYDHSKGSYGGAYLYLTAYRTADNSGAHSARIVSGPRDVVRGKSYCLSLYTQLNTADLSLTLSLLRLGPDITAAMEMKAIGTLANVKQTSWTLWNIQLNDSNIGTAGQIQLVLEGSLGTDSKGAIVIDDIQLLEGTCVGGGNNVVGLVCANGKQVNESQICDFVKDCPDGLDEASCGSTDFESGTSGGWRNASTYLRGFELVQASSVKDALAPAKDADSKLGGHYMLAASTGKFSLGMSGEMAINNDQPSMFLKLAYRTCVMVFDYYIKSIGKPKLDVKVGTNRANLATVYKIHGQTNGVWRKGYAHISNRYRPFFVDIHAHSTDKGVAGIDNVQFINCSLPVSKSTCETSEFRCTKNQFCISRDSICDYVNDCGDDSDETDCYKLPLRCNLESTLYSCHIVDESDHKIGQWKLSSPRDSLSFSTNTDYEPSIDNTLHTPYGHYYMLVPPFAAKTAPFRGQFSTAMLTSKADKTCKLRFFYYIADAPDTVSSTKLEIRIRYATQSNPENSVIQTISIDAYSDVQQRWSRAVVSLSYSSPFQVIFIGTLGTNTSRIAVDDLTFDEGCTISNALPARSTTTAATPTDGPNPITNGPMNPTDGTVTDKPKIQNNSKRSSGHGGTIAAGILVPLFIVAGAVGALIFYKRRQQTYARDDTFSFSIKRVTDADM